MNIKKNIPILSFLAGLASLGMLASGCHCSGNVTVQGTPFTVYAPPVVSSGSNATCHVSYIGCVTYITNGTGWKPISGVAHTAADGGGRTDTTVYYLGKLLDSGCGQTSVSIPTNAPSSYYRFVIYFPTNLPTTNYPIILNGFN